MLRIYCALFVCLIAVQTNAATENNLDYLNLKTQGRSEYQNGAYAAAEKSYIAALKTLERSDYQERAETLAELGNVYTNEDKLSKAEQAYVDSLALYKQLPNKREMATTLRHLGALYSLQRRDDDALRALEQALKLTRVNPDKNLTADVLNIIGVVYYRQGKNTKAANSFNEAVKIAYGGGIPAFLAEQLLNNLGNVYQAQRKYPEAEALLKRALQLIESEVGPSHPDATYTLSSLAFLYAATKRYADAEEQYQRALAILEPRHEEFETRIARVLHALGAMYAKEGRKLEAETALARAAELARRHVSEHVDMASIIEDYSASLQKHGHSKEASELLAEVRRARLASSLVTIPRSAF
jgi:tetratricopeptide (TPR) repeat protein